MNDSVLTKSPLTLAASVALHQWLPKSLEQPVRTFARPICPALSSTTLVRQTTCPSASCDVRRTCSDHLYQSALLTCQGINPTTQLSSEVSLDWTNATKQPVATQDGSQKCARHKSRPDSLLDVNDKPCVSFFEESLEVGPASVAHRTYAPQSPKKESLSQTSENSSLALNTQTQNPKTRLTLVSWP